MLIDVGGHPDVVFPVGELPAAEFDDARSIYAFFFLYKLPSCLLNYDHL